LGLGKLYPFLTTTLQVIPLHGTGIRGVSPVSWNVVQSRASLLARAKMLRDACQSQRPVLYTIRRIFAYFIHFVLIFFAWLPSRAGQSFS
jgi:hypothetical protein